MSHRARFVLSALALVLAASSGNAHAYTCTVSASSTAFGAYSPFAPTPLDTTGVVQVRCSLLGLLSLLVSYTIGFGQGGSGSYAMRSMMGGSQQLNYNLYTNAARTTIWGNGSAGTATISDGYLLGLLTTTRSYTVYGRMPAGQNVTPGSYMDAIVVTVDF